MSGVKSFRSAPHLERQLVQIGKADPRYGQTITTPSASAVATEREADGRADLAQACGRELGDPASQCFALDGDEVLKIDGAPLLHAVLGTEDHFRRDATDDRRDRGGR